MFELENYHPHFNRFYLAKYWKSNFVAESDYIYNFNHLTNKLLNYVTKSEGADMLTEYIHAALKRAEYKKLEDGSWFAEIPEF